MLRPSKCGLDTNSITLVSSHDYPPCSDCFLSPPVYPTPTFGITTMSGVRGSPPARSLQHGPGLSGTPGGLKSTLSEGPTKIWPSPTVVPAFSKDVTACPVVPGSASQSCEMSSSASPSPLL